MRSDPPAGLPHAHLPLLHASTAATEPSREETWNLMAGDAVGLVCARHPRVDLFVDPSLRLRVSKAGSFVRELLGGDVVILKGGRTPRAPRPQWGFYHQSEDPLVSPTVSEVDAADGMLSLAASGCRDAIASPLHRRGGSRGAFWRGPYSAKRPRLGGEGADGAAGRGADAEGVGSREATAVEEEKAQAPQARARACGGGVSTSTNASSPGGWRGSPGTGDLTSDTSIHDGR